MRSRRGRKVAVSMGKAAQTCLYRRVRRCAHVVLRGRSVTLCDIQCVSGGIGVRDRRGIKVAVGKATKTCLCRCVRRCAHVVLRGRHFVTFDVFQEEFVCATVLAEKLPCLWGKPHKRVSFDASEDFFNVVLRGRCGTL